MPDAPIDMTRLGSTRRTAPAWHAQRIAQEMAGPEPKDRMQRVIRRMGAQAVPPLGEIDWDAERAGFGEIDAHAVAAPLWTRVARR